MAKKNNRKCIICGKEYYYCSHNCTDSIDKPSWYAIFDSDDCHELYRICTDFRDKKIEVKEARKELSKFNIDNLENFNEGFKKIIEDILSVEIKEEKVIEDENADIDKNKEENTKVINTTKNKTSRKSSSASKNVKKLDE